MIIQERDHGRFHTLIFYHRVLAAVLVLSGLVLSTWPARGASTTYYVDALASGAGTGANWTDAYTMLQDALATAVSGDKIWVAAGVYYPDEGVGRTNNDRTASFAMVNGVSIYGGFAGDETSLSQRDWDANVTVLSGDIDKNDSTNGNGVVTDVANIVGNNAYHVVTGGGTNPSAILDGFTITAGQANGSGLDSLGGGMFNSVGSPALINISLTANYALGGGGGMANYQSNPILGGVTFLNNFAAYGGGMSNGQSIPSLTGVRFTGNEASTNGGGMSNGSSSGSTLQNVIFSGNQAGTSGGGMYNLDSNTTLLNVIFSGNRAVENGGGICNQTSNPTLNNVTLNGNYAGNRAGGVYDMGSSSTITNSILWGNQAVTAGHQLYDDGGAPMIITYSDVQGSGGSGVGNIDVDPLFVTPVVALSAPTTSGDVHLQADSPSIDSGDNGPCLAIDLDGNTRPIDGDLDGTPVCDMGAYEKLIDLFLPLILR